MKKIMWIVSIISLAGTAIALQFMPDTVPMHYDAAGNIDRWGSKYENLIFPVFILAMALFWTLFIRYYEKKAEKASDGKAASSGKAASEGKVILNGKSSAEARSNAKVLSIVGLAMAVMFTVMQGFILYGAYTGAVSGADRQTADIGKVACILMGLVFIVLGNFMTRTRINTTVGLRVSWSMYNDNTWRKSNQFAAYAIIAAGIVTIILAVVIKNSFIATMASLGALLLACVIALAYAHKVYVKEIESGGRKADN